VAITNEEALAERARNLYAVPAVIDAGEFGALSPACQAALAPSLYAANVAGDFDLQKPPHQLTDTERYSILECLNVPNGIRSVEVKLVGNLAELEVHFFNRNLLGQIYSDVVVHPERVKSMFPVTGGHRLPGGQAAGQVQVTQVNTVLFDPAALTLTVAPVGDYSTYKLGVDTLAYPNFDPVFNDVPFKFRPGCFNTNCAPRPEPGAERKAAPVIDYLAKDYDSFRHTMIAAMMERVPGWEATSEADLDEVLLDLFSAAADELSDFQDRVMNEARLATARKRVSLARHARLMDYHIHQGNQASTWVALELQTTPPPVPGQQFWLKNKYKFWAGGEKDTDPSAVVFVTRDDGRDGQPVHPFVNRLGLYTWSNTAPALEAGSTTADLRIVGPPEDQPTAELIRDLIRAGEIQRLLIQEYLNPLTGTSNGRDPNRRQLLRLLSGDEGARAVHDPLTGKWLVRVRWREEDRLQSNYCFTVECPQVVDDVSFFHGNLVRVFHGRPTASPVIFREPGAPLAPADEFHYEPTRWGTLCRLPKTLSPLAYRSTETGAEPNGDAAPVSTLAVTISPGGLDPWDEMPNLIHSDASDENGDHFVVETDELGLSLVRFGNGTNGKRLPEGAVVTCDFQYGAGPEGNIGLDKLTYFDRAAAALISRIGVSPKTVLDAAHGTLLDSWNPFDVRDGRAPEPATEIIRRVPEAYRARQLRAVTLKDYVRRAQEVAGVSRAAASYAWTGSWRTVRVTIDPAGTNTLSDALRRDVARYLEAVRLVGEDLEIRPPLFVPLDIRVALCAGPDYWPEDLRFELEQEFSAGFTPDGRKGFFHPDLWTFGQPLRASQIVGRIRQVEGVEHVISVAIKRWNAPTPPGREITRLRPNEIIQVLNDPDHLERGFIFFDIRGGRQ
jgi:hypothetical protein